MTDRTIAAPIASTASIDRTLSHARAVPCGLRDNGTEGASMQLAETGGGTVTATEAGEDGAAQRVEVRLEEGRQSEVDLHENVNIIGQDADDDGHQR
jgi:hypothetical protein